MTKIIPETSMTIDAASGTIVVIDKVTRLKRYDRLIKALDRPADGNRVVQLFPLDHTDAIALADVLTALIAQEQSGQGGQGGGRSGGPRGGGSGSGATGSEIAIVPDNECRIPTLIVSSAQARAAKASPTASAAVTATEDFSTAFIHASGKFVCTATR